MSELYVVETTCSLEAFHVQSGIDMIAAALDHGHPVALAILIKAVVIHAAESCQISCHIVQNRIHNPGIDLLGVVDYICNIDLFLVILLLLPKRIYIIYF